MFHFAYDARDVLRAEEVDLADIAERAGTPTYVYSRATLERHYRVFDEAFAGHPHLICYSVKANTSRAVLRLLGSLGSGADIVSGGELERVIAAGIPADRVVFSGVGKTAAEMRRALEVGIRAFNVESEPELETLDLVAAALGVVAPVSLRVNPDVDPKTHPYIATGLAESKFGIPIAEAPRLAERARALESVRLVGLDCHIGSQLTSIEPLLEALGSILALADVLKHAGHPIHDLDLGGGLGIPYSDEVPPLPAELGARVRARLRGRDELLILEPGRVIVGNAGILLTRLLYVKRTPGKTFYVVDAAMNDLVRPALYGAHHEIWPARRRPGNPRVVADVVGPICESSDVLAAGRELEEAQPGDLLAVMSAGAYGFSMASTYNSRPLAAEVMVSGDRFEVIRCRQTIGELMGTESVPDFITEG
ncbi:MAG: diaminopimelate decarboxylase [Deltaproteobacteria bacterium]|nr:diaminopimelate decarboxylase [Deltaproteobacteria bacterium]